MDINAKITQQEAKKLLGPGDRAGASDAGTRSGPSGAHVR
jgi:hypothetical protein